MSKHYFYVRKDHVNKDGLAHVMIRYYFDRNEIKYFPTDIYIPPKDWSFQNRWPKNKKSNSEIIRLLSSFDIKLKNIVLELKEKHIEPTASIVKELFLSDSDFEQNGKPLDFIGQLDSFINRREVNKEVSADTIKDYKSLRKHLLAFQNAQGYKLKFDHLNYDFYKKFLNYLLHKTEKPDGATGLRINSAGKQIKNLKIFVKDRIQSGIIPFIDLSSFKTVTENTSNVYLNRNEISKILNTELDNERLEKCRDILVIGCLTGLRYSDLSRISADRVRDGMIHLKQRKTKDIVYIPLRSEAKEKLVRYGNNIPKMSLTEFNRLVKEVCKHAEIDSIETNEYKIGNELIEEQFKKYELISSHTCRRSFCTNEYLAGTDVKLIMQVSGHKTEKSFRRYLQLDGYESALKLKDMWGV